MGGRLEVDDVLAECTTWPLPGRGATGDRWERLTDLGRRDLALAKLVEPHHDAVAILDELGGAHVRTGELWAVWAAEPPFAVLEASQDDDGSWTVCGAKAFCSGADLVTHALVTASTPAGPRLFAVPVQQDRVRVERDAPAWAGAGMRRARTVTLRFDDVPAEPVGEPGAYTARPGFWLGAIGIAACWFGGAQRVAERLEAGAERLDPHGLAHLGAVRAEIEAFALAMGATADRADAGLDDAAAQRLALVLRARAADLVDDVVQRVGRATGPGPLVFDGPHAQHVADLQVFVRQHHAERDLEALGRLP
jgi:alkylation response protein AidB-like acyl-CoA dehydrogenase